MSPAIVGGMAEYEDTDYDVYALLDSVPRVVRELDRPGARIGALLAAFLGVGTPAFGDDAPFHP